MSFLDFPGLQYFYNKYLKPIKPHAREETIKSYTVNEQGHVPDAQLVAQLKEENESLQAKVEALNSALETYEEFVTNEWYIGRYGNTKALVYNGNIPSKWNGNYQFMLNSGNLLPEKYRPQKGFGIVVPVTNTGIKCLVDIRKEGGIYITPSEDIADKQWITIFIPYI